MRSARVILPLLLLALTAVSPALGGPSLFDRVKDRAKQKGEQKTDQQVDKASDAAAKAVTPDANAADANAAEAKPGDKNAAAAGTAATPGGGTSAEQLKPGEGAWANYDFKPGNRVLYADDFMKDEVGDFPRGMEFVEGAIEIVEWQGGRWLRCNTRSKFKLVLPEVLPERYTLEFDYTIPEGEVWVFPMDKDYDCGNIVFRRDGIAGIAGGWENYRPQVRTDPNPAIGEKIVHARVMTDGGYVKLYINDKRMVNVPNFDPRRANKIEFYLDASEKNPALLGNFRVAAGGKKLYDALAADGRVATQGIYFDTGSDRIRPESSPTLKEIAGMLTEHGDLKLLIEGHTDNVGAAAANQTLSEKRAAAVRQALIDNYSVAGDRLTTKGFGATKPVGSNDTPAGRQTNRRVELVKM